MLGKILYMILQKLTIKFGLKFNLMDCHGNKLPRNDGWRVFFVILVLEFSLK